MLNPDVGLLDIGGVQCSGVVSPFSVLDLPVLGATTSHRTSTTFVDNGIVLNIYAGHGVHPPRGHLCCYWGRNHLDHLRWRVAC